MPKQNPVVQSSDERHTQRGVSVMQITLKESCDLTASSYFKRYFHNLNDLFVGKYSVGNMRSHSGIEFSFDSS